jgi:hypothetical protein
MAIALMPIDDAEDGYAEVLKDILPERLSGSRILNSMNDLMIYYDQESLRIIDKEVH